LRVPVGAGAGEVGALSAGRPAATADAGAFGRFWIGGGRGGETVTVGGEYGGELEAERAGVDAETPVAPLSVRFHGIAGSIDALASCAATTGTASARGGDADWGGFAALE
jgi:hypothetical protein